MSHPKPLLYNPDQKPKQQLIDEFVIRQKEYTSLMNGIADASPQTSPQHYLVVGQRGMGKTTLLLRVKYAIEDHPQLKNWLIPIRFSEEQYQIARLDRLWEEIAEHLEMANPLFDGLLQEMQQHEESEGYDRIALDVLVKTLKKHKKRVLVMVDNLGDLFNKFSDEENHRLREVLLGKIEIQLMGASSSVLEHTFRYDKPFYEFFQQITLQPINKGSSFQLLEALGKQYGQEDKVSQLIQENPAKIEVLRRLTGGVPRTMALLFGIFIDHQQGTTFEDLRLLLDGVNSLYKHRMDEMKPQQQQIVDALAKAWDPILSSEVLKRSKLNRENIATNQISAQLKVLADNQIVEALSGKGKNKTYRIRERFFNIWYLMRHGKRQHREEVLWLVRFLETWCATKEELLLQANEHLQALQRGNYSKQAAYLKTMALYHVEGLESSKKLQLLEQTEVYLKDPSEETNARVITKAKGEELDQWVKRIVEKVERQEEVLIATDLPNGSPESTIYIIHGVINALNELKKPLLQIKNLLELGIQLGDNFCMNHLEFAYQAADLITFEQDYLMAIEKGDVAAMYNLALLYEKVKKEFDLSEKYYLMAVGKGHAASMNRLANLYRDQKELELAENYYLMASEEGHVGSMYNLALFYHQDKKDIALAEKYYLMASEKGNIDATYNLAWLYHKKKQFKLAEKYYLISIDNELMPAMYNLALLYHQDKKDFVLAEKYYLMAFKKGDIASIYNLAWLYHQDKNDLELAEKYYLMAVKNEHAAAMSNLALLYKQKNDLGLAEKYYLMAIQKGSTEAIHNLAVLYDEEKKDWQLAEKYFLMAIEKGQVQSMKNLANLYVKKGAPGLAEKYYLMAIEEGDTSAIINLALFYHHKMHNDELAEKYYLIAIEAGDITAMNNLALLYENQRDFDLAEKYYLMAVEKGDSDAMSNLAFLYYGLSMGKETHLAEKYFRLAHSSGNTIASINLIVIYSQHNRTEELLQVAAEIMDRQEFLESDEYTYNLIYHILLKKQYHFLLQQFRKPEIGLMQHARPYYYVLAWFMRDELPGEYEKAGAEIKETVDEIIQVIEQKHKEGEFKQTE